jgi:hypothetical protein
VKHTPYNPNACPVCKPARCEVARRQELRPARRRKETLLNASELDAFAKVRRYVFKMCGPVSDAEVLRFLIRDWEAK